MRWHRVCLVPYSRPFQSPILVSSERLCRRDGFYLEGIDADGNRHYGECAPLPGWHHESLSDARSLLSEVLESFVRCEMGAEHFAWDQPYFGLWTSPKELPASLQSCLDMLLLSWMETCGLALHLPRTQSTRFEASALLPLPPQISVDDWRELVSVYKEREIVCFKIKLGRQSPDEERVWIDRLREFIGKPLELRLDINQQGEEQNLRLYKSWEKNLPIAYWEELSESKNSSLLDGWERPMARDESLRGVVPSESLVQKSVLVIKPNSLGLQQSIQWLRLANASGGRAILSNTYESEISLKLYAALYGSMIQRPEPLGFGTVASFADDSSMHWLDSGPWPDSPFWDGQTLPFGKVGESLWSH